MTMSYSTYFSVVIPLYNKEKYINRAIDSILNQTYINYEIIVVNDGSTDNGAEVVRSINSKKIKLITQDNKGVSIARNNGIEEAKGDFISFLDADDEWLPEYLETINFLINKYPGAGIYCTSYKHIKNKKEVIKDFGFEENYEGYVYRYFYKASKYRRIGNTNCITIPQKILKSNKMFDVELERGEDLELWFRIALKYPVVYKNRVLTKYNLDNDTNYRNKKDNEIMKRKKKLPINNISDYLTKIDKFIMSQNIDKMLIKDYYKYVRSYLFYRLKHSMIKNPKYIFYYFRRYLNYISIN